MTKEIKKRRMERKPGRRMDTISGYLLVAPNLIGFLVFTLFGIGFSLVMAFTDWNLVRGYEEANFVGLKNFKDMLTDPYLKACLINNAKLLLVLPIQLFLAAVLASLMNKAVYGKAGARAMYFLPYVTNIVAIATIWEALFHKTKGPVNALLMVLGISESALPGWLSSSQWALLAVAIVLLWKDLGYSILMYSGALQQIPQELYEAAEVDGAGVVAKFLHITIPQLAPMTFMLTILGVVSSLQMWGFVQVITNGGPGTSTYTLGLYIYRSSFITNRTGYACALAWLLTVLVLTFAIFRWRVERKFSVE
ncbi:MAG: sugar ABC transporter permease [Lachnospiraceae bacterium]|jgi:multiple sugar transport system permease protein|nr:sugar ABC transporter permease [Lachnospiraceae bacterium]